MKIDILSDLHGYYPDLEGGDLLIIAGDLTSRDIIPEYSQFFKWLGKQSYKKKILIGGNHDNFLNQCVSTKEAKECGLWEDEGHEYLCDSSTKFEGLNIWGSPWSLWFPEINPKCSAFTCRDEYELEQKWSIIPEDTDILITHTPAFGILDQVPDFRRGFIRNCGSRSLINVLDRIRPKLHVFGHIHENGGKIFNYKDTTCINASYVNERYQPVNKPIRIEL